jgi:hypothetical protein
MGKQLVKVCKHSMCLGSKILINVTQYLFNHIWIDYYFVTRIPFFFLLLQVTEEFMLNINHFFYSTLCRI